MVNSLQSLKRSPSSYYQGSPEYNSYKSVKLWRPLKKGELEETISKIRDSGDPLSILFFYLYDLTEKKYKTYPRRKDGSNPFLHPLNLISDLQKSGIDDLITLSAALIHDIVEEDVDLYKKENFIVEKGEGIKKLDYHEIQLFEELYDLLVLFCKDNKISVKVIKELLDVVKLLTRHKRDFYYHSISEIFMEKNKKTKMRAIQVKLADRIHNISCLDSFKEQARIYQCFKNIFILNNTKNYLLKLKKSRDLSKLSLTHKSEFNNYLAIEILFEKCCQSTYEAFLKVCNDSLNKGIHGVELILQLAFRKFVYKGNGLRSVTKFDNQEMHPIRLFKGIIRKYDSRLHQEIEKYDHKVLNEMNYCRNFFGDFKFNDHQIRSIILYKDAYALKEIISYLLYMDDYVITGFGCKELFNDDMICITRTRV